MSLTSFNFLDNQAARYKLAQKTIEESAEFIQNKIETETKEEKLKVDKAIPVGSPEASLVITSRAAGKPVNHNHAYM